MKLEERRHRAHFSGAPTLAQTAPGEKGGGPGGSALAVTARAPGESSDLWGDDRPLDLAPVRAGVMRGRWARAGLAISPHTPQTPA